MAILGLSAFAWGLIGAGSGLVGLGSVVGMRRLVQMGQFSYHNARLSTLGNPYVERDQVLPLIDLGSPRSIGNALTGELSVPQEVSRFKEVDARLVEAHHRTVMALRREAPIPAAPMVDAFLTRLELEELKRLIRSLGRRIEPLYPIGRLTSDVEKQFLSSKDLTRGMEHLEILPYMDGISSLMAGDNTDLFSIDQELGARGLECFRILDNYPRFCKKGGSAAADLLCDHYNIHLVLRAISLGLSRDEIIKKLYRKGSMIGLSTIESMAESTSVREVVGEISNTYLSPYLRIDEGGDLLSLEVGLDRMMLMGSVGLSNSFHSGIGPTFRYLVSLEMEVKNLRTIYQSAFSGWDADRTKRLLILREES